MPKLQLHELILFEDNDYLLVNKPPFLSTLEDRASDINLLKLVKEKYPDATVGHRLDKETSGVLIIAKNPEAYRWISVQFENRKVKKVYHAIVDGRVEYEHKIVDAPIEKTSDGGVRISSRGKKSETIFNTLKIFKNHSLVEALPTTGRMHQIRIHLSLIGTPITGDEMYGGKPLFVSSIQKNYKYSKGLEEEPLMKRFALHALRVSFEKPDGMWVDKEAPYPKDFKAIVNQLKKPRDI